MTIATNNSAYSSCLSRSADWRRDASHLRSLAERPHLNAQARTSLLRQAEAAERQADEWLNGAILAQ